MGLKGQKRRHGNQRHDTIKSDQNGIERVNPEDLEILYEIDKIRPKWD